MNLTVVRRGMLGAAITLGAVGYALVSSAQPAWAPQMVANELAAQRALGYRPCEPSLGEIPAQENPDGIFLADASGAGPGEHCEIRFASSVPAGDLDWVAWHEACHLSTLEAIYADPYRPIVDPAHRHVLFLMCLSKGPAENGGYLP